MIYSIQKMKRPVRQRLKSVIQKHADANYRRRANAMLLLHAGQSKAEIARTLSLSRSTVYDWINRYETYGETGLIPELPDGTFHLLYTVYHLGCFPQIK